MKKGFENVSAETMNKDLDTKVKEQLVPQPKPVKFQCALKAAGMSKPRNLVVQCSTIDAAKRYVRENLDNIESFQFVSAETMNKGIQAPADPMKPKKVKCKIMFKSGEIKNIQSADSVKIQKYITENFDKIQTYEII